MTAQDIETLKLMFGGTGILSEIDINDYFDVIRDAFAIHVEKERIRNGLWKEYPAEDQCNQIKIKIDRVIRSLERMRTGADLTGEIARNVLEEQHDIINYSVFTARIVSGKVS